MINSRNIASIDVGHLDIKGRGTHALVSRSRNTGRCQYLFEQVYNGNHAFLIYHKHNIEDAYHPQKSRPSISTCCEYIRVHDAFHLEGIKKKNDRRERSIYIKQQTYT